jgi:hypothetical protein
VVQFQPSRTYAQYDLAALVSVLDIDETMMDIDETQENSQQLQVTRKIFFIQMG